MAKQTINTGLSANDRTGDTLRTTGTKINANFTELYNVLGGSNICLLYTSPSPRDRTRSRMPSSA